MVDKVITEEIDDHPINKINNKNICRFIIFILDIYNIYIYYIIIILYYYLLLSR